MFQNEDKLTIEDLHATISVLILCLLAFTTLHSTFTFFISHYWVYSLLASIIAEFFAIRHINKYINKYGLITLLVVMVTIPLLSFYSVPKFLHKTHLVPTMTMKIKGIVEHKFYFRKNNEYHIEIRLKHFKPNKIQTIIHKKIYNKLKVGDSIEVQGSLSYLGFDYKKTTNITPKQ